MNYPGIDHIRQEKDAYFRSVGNLESGNQLGFGFMHKDGITVDEDRSVFSYYSCSYVIRGLGTYIDSAGRRYALSPGSLFQRIPGTVHSTIIDPESRWAECFIDFGSNLFRGLLAPASIVNPETPVLKIKEDRTVEEEIWALLLELEDSPESDLPDLLIKGLAVLRSLLNRGADKPAERSSLEAIERSCRDFTRDYRSRMDLRRYCSERGIGYEAFRKNFQKHTGLPPGRYIIRRRIDMACHLLIMTAMTVKEIALELGYQSPYEFSAQFKNITGSSPRSYRMKKI